MSVDLQYDCDCEFVKLLTRRSDVDLTRAALELARDACPRLDFQPTLDWIDARAAELLGPIARAVDEAVALHELGRLIADEHGIWGDCGSFETADGSFLHRVIETRRGLPITLSVLYMAVARQAGLELKGVSAPRHFLTRYEAIDGPLFVDAFHRGRVMTSLECKKWLHEACGVPRSAVCASLRPVGPRAIITRMLNNLKMLYLRQQNWLGAWNVQHRLAALEPGSYSQRRDLALISLHAGRPGHAVDLLQSCLRSCPAGERPILRDHLQHASSQLAAWN